MRPIQPNAVGQGVDARANDCRGFTMIELITVLVLLSLVTGTVTFSLRGNIANSRAEFAIEKLQLVDRQLRDSAIRSGRTSALRIDLARGKMTRSIRGQQETVIEDSIPALRFRSPVIDTDEDQAVVQFLPDGTSMTYAICLRQSAKARTWLIFAGLTGQSLVTSDAGEVEQLLRR